MFVQSTNQWRN